MTEPTDDETNPARITERGRAELARGGESAARFAARSRSESTERTYKGRLEHFAAWCASVGFESKPPVSPELVATYISRCADAGQSPGTIRVALSAISKAHQLMGEPTPTQSPIVKDVWSGIRRTLGMAPKYQADALSPKELRLMVRAVPAGPLQLRDRALLLAGFAGCFRGSEVRTLDVENVKTDPDGLTLYLRKSKGDQEGHGESVAVPFGSDRVTCPVRAINAWLDASALKTGPLFPSVRGRRLARRDVNRIVKRCAKRAGLTGRISGHSLRAGLITTAAKAGRSLPSIQRQSRHKDIGTLMGYVRQADAFEDNAAAGIGL
jgi:site-specific recombinase XerD